MAASIPRASLPRWRISPFAPTRSTLHWLYMCYHLPMPHAALAEIRRVVRPGGTVVVSTNDDRVGGLWNLFKDAGHDREPASAHWPLHEADVSLMTAGFSNTRRLTFDYTLNIPSPLPVIDYLDSCRPELVGIPSHEWTVIRQR